MILRMPEYCREFKCSAGACSDSCCIGWEIDIDGKTADFYKTLGGEFGERLKNNISCGDVSSFILKNERCPFLNDKNLCDIILNIGEDKLCHICAEHPRYYEWFDGITEGGTGLCCEESARLILEKGLDAGYWEREIPDEACEEYDTALYNVLFGARDKILAVLRNEEVELSETVARILDYADELQLAIDNEEYTEAPDMPAFSPFGQAEPDAAAMLDIFYDLEPIDEGWKPFIRKIRAGIPELKWNIKPYEHYLRSIGVYFIWRYFLKGVFDGEILSKVKLAVVSMAMSAVMFCSETADSAHCVILAKNYSKETEYSEENLEALYDMTYTESVFSAESLKNFFI